MKIDLSKLSANIEDELLIDREVNIPFELMKDGSIKGLENVKFTGKIIKLIDDEYELSGTLRGTMILLDDITLEDTEYGFDINIEENITEYDEESENNLQIINNSLDILDILWQNILIEVPSKVRNEKNKDIKLEGNGWRLINEEDINSNPFEELKDKIDMGKE